MASDLTSYPVTYECDYCEGMFHDVMSLRGHRYKIHGIRANTNSAWVVGVDHPDPALDARESSFVSASRYNQDIRNHPQHYVYVTNSSFLAIPNGHRDAHNGRTNGDVGDTSLMSGSEHSEVPSMLSSTHSSDQSLNKACKKTPSKRRKKRCWARPKGKSKAAPRSPVGRQSRHEMYVGSVGVFDGLYRPLGPVEVVGRPELSVYTGNDMTLQGQICLRSPAESVGHLDYGDASRIGAVSEQTGHGSDPEGFDVQSPVPSDATSVGMGRLELHLDSDDEDYPHTPRIAFSPGTCDVENALHTPLNHEAVVAVNTSQMIPDHEVTEAENALQTIPDHEVTEAETTLQTIPNHEVTEAENTLPMISDHEVTEAENNLQTIPDHEFNVVEKGSGLLGTITTCTSTCPTADEAENERYLNKQIEQSPAWSQTMHNTVTQSEPENLSVKCTNQKEGMISEGVSHVVQPEGMPRDEHHVMLADHPEGMTRDERHVMTPSDEPRSNNNQVPVKSVSKKPLRNGRKKKKVPTATLR